MGFIEKWAAIYVAVEKIGMGELDISLHRVNDFISAELFGTELEAQRWAEDGLRTIGSRDSFSVAICRVTKIIRARPFAVDSIEVSGG